ncbi:MAG: nicotinate phosphoribosyltransferase [Bacteroidota bacterium]|nr:nicotinate phosphoribosyltransferase [Bacteroidota bacterium]
MNHNNLVTPLLNDLYEYTMAYAYWKSGRHEDTSVFDLFIRENPFGGEFTIFAGLEEAVNYVRNFHLTENDIEYIRSVLPNADEEFFIWLKSADCSRIKIFSPKEGTIVFPMIPLLRVEGPLGIAQLLETTLLNLINYPSLVATNAARMKLAAGKNKGLLEFGLRRAQGPNGGLTASRYSYLGGFDATSNVLAGKTYGIPLRGTLAHAFVSTFSSLKEIPSSTITTPDGKETEFVSRVLDFRKKLNAENSHEGELAAFIAYAQAFPKSFLALVDTYDTLKSGVPNFLAVALALHSAGYVPVGVRLDSGDLAYLSKQTREQFRKVSSRFHVPFERLSIVASNNINEATLHALAQQGHEIDVFGIGTHLVTCEAQPALGGVYKLVEVNGEPRIKLSQEKAKTTIPGKKEVYRLIDQHGFPMTDLMIRIGEAPPKVGEKILCRHPFEEAKRAYIKPSDVMLLHQCVWDGKRAAEFPTLEQRRQFVLNQISSFRQDHLRYLNPTPYKVSVSESLYNFIHEIWQREMPVAELE